MRKCHTRIIRCVWICLNEQCAVVGCLLLFSIFAITFAPPCPLSLGHMLCHATTWCDVCLFFSSHLQWMSSYDSIWIEHRKTQQKTMAMLRAWFLTPPQRKWNERAKSVRDARKPLFRMNLTDWLGQKRNKYTKLHMEHFHHFSFVWSALCVFLYQQQITI